MDDSTFTVEISYINILNLTSPPFQFKNEMTRILFGIKDPDLHGKQIFKLESESKEDDKKKLFQKLCPQLSYI